MVLLLSMAKLKDSPKIRYCRSSSLLGYCISYTQITTFLINKTPLSLFNLWIIVAKHYTDTFKINFNANITMACDTAKSWQIQIIDCQLFYFLWLTSRTVESRLLGARSRTNWSQTTNERVPSAGTRRVIPWPWCCQFGDTPLELWA